MDRRRFAQLSALTLAATQLPSEAQSGSRNSAQTPDTGKRIGFAPVGLGSIAEVFMRAVSISQSARLVTTSGHDPRFAQEEEAIEFMIKFPSGIIASCGSSYSHSAPSAMQLNGSAGSVHMEPAFGYGNITLTYTGTTKDNDISGGLPVTNPDQFAAEVEHFSNCIRNNTQPNTPGEEGLADLLAIEAIYKAAGTPIA